MEQTAVGLEAIGESVAFLDHFKELPDPRQRGKITYPLGEVLLLCLLVGASSAPYGNFFGAPSRSISRKGAIITGRYWLVCCPESSSDRGLVDRTSWLGHRGESWATPEGTGSRPARAGKDRIITHPIGHETGWTAARSLGEVGTTSVHSKPICLCSDCTFLDETMGANKIKELL